jgi:hypothetical protein
MSASSCGIRRCGSVALFIAAIVLVSMSMSAAAFGAVAARAIAARTVPRPVKPAAETGAAADVSYSGATLTGVVNPHRQATYYYFQYGQTAAFGLQTPLAEAGAGSAAVPVSVPISGLAPLTRYRFRLVAVSAAGTTVGRDRILETTKVPLSLQIVSSPNPVAFGGPVSVQGTLSGTGNANREVVLQGNAFPFTAGFADVGNPELTSAAGGFSFVVLGLGATTQYRVVTATDPAVISPAVTETVTVLVTARHAPVRRRPRRVRIYGTVTPAENGMRIEVMRLRDRHEKRSGGAVLRADGPGRSSFSVRIPRRPGAYRVLALVTGAQAAAYSASFLVR